MSVLKAEEPIYGGYVLSHAEGIVFVRGAIPGEVVEVSIDEKKRDYSVATVIEVVEPSPSRREPPCSYFGECGGCQLQFVDYPTQVTMKHAVLKDCLRRIAHVEDEPAEPLFGPEFGYRRRAQFKVSREGRVGFFRESSREVVPISKCPLMCDEINAVIPALPLVGLEGVREIHVTSGDVLMASLKGVGYDEALADRLMAIGFAGVAFSDGRFRGTSPAYVTLDLNGLTYTVSPRSFFQSNWELNRRLEALVSETLGDMSGARILDLYSGGGNFSLSLAVGARRAVAVEESAHAIGDGERNAAVNRITGMKFLKGTAETARFQGEFDVLLLDPPRPGLTPQAFERVMSVAAQRIVYISCNPSTLARDLKKFAQFYRLQSIRMVDFFPNTYHVEAVAFMVKKSPLELEAEAQARAEAEAKAKAEAEAEKAKQQK